MVEVLSIVGLGISAIGGVILVKPILKSKELIKGISTYEDSGAILDVGVEEKTNPHLKESLERDNILGIVGISLLVFGFILQIVGYVIR